MGMRETKATGELKTDKRQRETLEKQKNTKESETEEKLKDRSEGVRKSVTYTSLNSSKLVPGVKTSNRPIT